MAGYSATPLAKKLGYKAGTLAWVHAMPPDYPGWLAPLPEGVAFQKRADAHTGLHHLFVGGRAELAALLPRLRKSMGADAAIWVSWPKKSAKQGGDLGENDIRALALPLGLVDIKVCAVSEVWSGLKLVLRKEHRQTP